MIAGGCRVRDEVLGDAQELAIKRVFEGATSVVLVEMARHDRNDSDLPDRLAAEFGKFYGDRLVAETLVGVALSKEEPPFEKLRRRFSEVGGDPEALPMDFGAALEILVYELADRLRREASRAGSPLANLVQLSELETIKGELKELVGGLKGDGGKADEAAPGPELSDPRFVKYERGPNGASFDVLFAGFFLPSGPEGRFTSGGASRAVEREFLEIFRGELDGHHLNTLGIEIEGAVLRARVLDYRPPAGYAGAHDYESFSELTKHLAQGTLGVVWGTIREGGGLGTLEIVVNPDRFYGGSTTLATFSGVKSLADREDLASRAKTFFAARVLAAMFTQSFCAGLDHRGMHNESYMVASDSRRLLERALEDLGRELGSGERAAVEEQRRALLPHVVRQEASSLWQQGELKLALGRLLDSLKIWPYGPLSGRGAFREYCEARYAFSLAGRVQNWRQFLAENYEDAPVLRRDLARQYADRALVGLPPVDLGLFLDWVVGAFKRGVDIEEDVERWFSELVACHPEEPFVVAFWGEARRLMTVNKYGAGVGSPSSWRMDRAREKFEEAYRMDSGVPYFAARVQAIGFTAAFAFGITEEGRRRFDEAAGWWEKAKPYYREHAPWMLEESGEADTPERLGKWVEERYGEGRGEESRGAFGG